jgi:hypothetical protein
MVKAIIRNSYQFFSWNFRERAYLRIIDVDGKIILSFALTGILTPTPLAVQPVASRYTDYAIPALHT